MQYCFSFLPLYGLGVSLQARMVIKDAFWIGHTLEGMEIAVFLKIFLPES